MLGVFFVHATFVNESDSGAIFLNVGVSTQIVFRLKESTTLSAHVKLSVLVHIYH